MPRKPKLMLNISAGLRRGLGVAVIRRESKGGRARNAGNFLAVKMCVARAAEKSGALARNPTLALGLPLMMRLAIRIVGVALLANPGAAFAQHSPRWVHGATCYEVFVRSFYDSDGDGIGDLRGLTAKLDYINDGDPASTASLGANCIWLMPIDKSASYHGYDIVDYYHVDPRYGTDDDFRSLVREAHRRG